MLWILFVILSAVLNAFWVAYSKKFVRDADPIYFSFLLRVFTTILLLIPFFITLQNSFSSDFVFYTIISGITGGFGTAFLLIGVKKDFYSSYAFYNISPVFLAFFSLFLLKEEFHFLLLPSIASIIIGSFVFYKGNHFSFWGLVSCLVTVVAIYFAKLSLKIGNVYNFIFYQKAIETITILVTYLIVQKVTRSNGNNSNNSNPSNKRKFLFPGFIAGAASAGATILFYIGLQIGEMIYSDILFKSSMIFGFFISFFYLKEHEMIGHKILGSLFILTGVILVTLIKV